MSKKKRFFRPGLQTQETPRVEPVINKDHQDATHNEIDDSPTYHKLLKMELMSVLIVVLVIVVGFAVLWYSNESKPWIERVSNQMLSKIVRNF